MLSSVTDFSLFHFIHKVFGQIDRVWHCMETENHNRIKLFVWVRLEHFRIEFKCDFYSIANVRQINKIWMSFKWPFANIHFELKIHVILKCFCKHEMDSSNSEISILKSWNFISFSCAEFKILRSKSSLIEILNTKNPSLNYFECEEVCMTHVTFITLIKFERNLVQVVFLWFLKWTE